MGRKHHAPLPSTPKPGGLTLDDLAKELDTYSSTISTQIRSVNLSVLGLTWLLLLRDDKLGSLVDKFPHRGLLIVSAACIIAMVLDLAQYFLAERAVATAFETAQDAGAVDGFETDSWTYRGSFWCYQGKVWLTALAAISLVSLVTRAVL